MTPTIFVSMFLFLVQPAPFSGECVAVVDGDTLDVMNGTERVRIRIEGIDAPEWGQAYGWRAQAFTEEFAKNRKVMLIPKEVDKFGRTVARVIVDGKDLSNEIVRSGWAWHLKQDPSDETLELLERVAREEKTGIWIDEKIIAPWDYRKEITGPVAAEMPVVQPPPPAPVTYPVYSYRAPNAFLMLLFGAMANPYHRHHWYSGSHYYSPHRKYKR